MSLTVKGFPNGKDTSSSFSNKVTALNPNAAEFVPSALRSPFGSAIAPDSSTRDVPETYRKPVLDRNESSVSNGSDDEARRFWQRQLPDDITPDFKAMGEDELQVSGLSLAGLSIHDGVGSSRSPLASSRFLGTQSNGSLGVSSLIEKLGSAAYADDQGASSFINHASNTWNERFLGSHAHAMEGTEKLQYNEESTVDFPSDLGDHAALHDAMINPLEFLASQFPGFAAESLAEIYYANGCDLNLTIEILTQLELQVDGGFNHNVNPKPAAAPSLTALDFPALPAGDPQNGLSKYTDDGYQQTPTLFRQSSSSFGGAADFASAVRKLASHDSGSWKYGRSNSADGTVGSSRASQLLSSAYNGHGKLGKAVYGDKPHGARTNRAAPVWLDTGETVANMYSESREEARDLARVRNAYFEQASQAFLIGNKALAKELSAKGHLYNMQMKAAHENAKEAIYRQRNPISSEMTSGASRGQERLIDLHGLHVNEAIHILKHELGVLRSAARLAGQRLPVMICVGTGHHTKGSRTPARLPVAVEHFLLEEGIHFTQPQPGLLRVVIY